jgi:hypothetical protein
MSKHHSLSDELNQYTQRMQYPEHLDEKIEKLYKAHFMKKPTSLVFQRFTRPALVIAASLFLFSGIAYASTVLYSLHSKQVDIQVSRDAAFNLPDSVVKELGQTFQSIRNQLAPGESAVVYSAELESRKFPNLQVITNPKYYTNLEQWRAEVNPSAKGMKLPESLPNGYTFVRGELKPPFGAIDESTYNRYHSLLQNQAKAAGTSTAWQKDNSLSLEGPFPNMPGLVYRNSQQEDIVVRYQLINPDDKNILIKTKTNESASAENVKVNGKEGYYSEMNQFFLSETGVSKSVQWAEVHNGQTILYSVETSSMHISKEELLAFANC